MHQTVVPVADQPYQHANGDWAWSPSEQDLFRKYDNFGRGMLFQRNASRPRLAYSGSLRLQKSTHLSEGFLIFYWTQFILSGENYQRWTPKIKTRPPSSQQTEGRNSSGSKEEDTIPETVMRAFAGEYGRGVRQENVRSKTKELTGTLPYALSMCPTTSQPR